MIRRSVLAVALLLGWSQAGAEPVRTTITLAHTQVQDPDSDTAAAISAEFKRELERRTEGAMTVAIFPNGQLGGNRDLTKLVANRVIETALVTVGGIASRYPLIAVTQMPFALDTRETAERVFDGPFGQALAADIEAKVGLTVLGFGDPGGLHVLTNSVRPVHGPFDTNGLKLRTVPGLESLNAMIEGIGGVPVKVSSREELTALAGGVIDGQMNPAPVIVTRRYDEVQKYATLTNHLYAPYVWVFNSAALAGLTPEQQAAIRDSARHAIVAGRAAARAMEASENGLPKLRRRMQVTDLSPAEREAFRAATQPAVAQAIAATLGAEGTSLLQQFIDAARQ